MKNIKVICSLIVVLMLVGPLNVQAQGICPTCIQEEQPKISISRTGKIEAEPDMAEIVLSIWIEEVRANKALEKIKERLNDIMAAAQNEGIAKNDVKTMSYQITPQYDKNIFSSIEKPKSYVVSQSVMLTVRKLDQLGSLLGKLSAIDSMNIQSTSFTSSRIEELKREAIVKAAEEARLTATELAKAAGAKLGKVLTIQESSTFQPYMREQSRNTLMKAVAAYDSEVPVSAGTLTINASCTLVYELVE